MSQRTERVDELLRQEIGAIVAREVADPRIGFATITSVETADDLRHAMPFIRHELGKRLRIRRIPDLHVHLDDTAERGTRILQMLAQLETGSIPEPDVAVAESLPTPVARLPHEFDLVEEPPSAVFIPPAPRPRRRRIGPRPATPRKGAR